jgi:hypothetical protein
MAWTRLPDATRRAIAVLFEGAMPNDPIPRS